MSIYLPFRLAVYIYTCAINVYTVLIMTVAVVRPSITTAGGSGGTSKNDTMTDTDAAGAGAGAAAGASADRKYHQMAVELILSAGERAAGDNGSGDKQSINNGKNGIKLSSEVANSLVDILENIYHPASSKDSLSVFMSSVHKFAFGLNQIEDSSASARVYKKLCDLLSAPMNNSRTSFVASLTQLPVSEW